MKHKFEDWNNNYNKKVIQYKVLIMKIKYPMIDLISKYLD
jgi:hypothetical protein